MDGLIAECRLEIAAGVRTDLFAAAARGYPREACGILLGRVDGSVRVVEQLWPTANRWPDRDDRYEIDPDSLRRALESEENGGSRVIGFYHSHPDALPVPSEKDRELAWPWYYYLIVRVVQGESREARAWELETDSNRFAERTVSYT